ncbi:uncharacterized protein BDV14DRAFT_195209 [Aspergillus stella-maris]|uniref:uncharacterized protein n=1 Tax=Aspergillus stella-maris TaxID=1810926 RepID=UPI003CCD69B2
MSVSVLGPDEYQMGSKIRCKQSMGGIPETAVASWQDCDVHYCLEEANLSPIPTQEAADGIIYQAGMSSAVWKIGTQAICKVKTWTEGMELERDTIAFVASCFPHVPLASIIHSWIDKDLSRSFLTMQRVPGRTLAEAWDSLTSEQRSQISGTVAQYCYDLAQVASEKLKSATGCGVSSLF